MNFEERERGFEAKFAHDETMRFRVEARRDKLFAEWAARHYDLAPADADHFHQAVLAIPGGPNHDAALVSLAYNLGTTAGDRPYVDPAAVLADMEKQAVQQSAEERGSPFDL